MPKTDHRVDLTATRIAKLAPAREGERYQMMDAQVPGFGVRVTDRGTKTFILRTRYPGDTTASRREIGKVSDMDLADARKMARQWRSWIKDGKDPARVEAEARAAEIRKQKMTFGAVIEDFIRDKISTERKQNDVEKEINRELLPKWKDKPIADITDADVSVLIKAKKKDGKVAAKNLFALTKRFFRWACAHPEYGLSASPCANLNATALLGEMPNSRERALNDGEIRAFWIATGQMEYPFKHAYRTLLLTALRKRECSDAGKDEFDREKSEWTIPASRMKGTDAGKRQSRPHIVPLTKDIVAILDDMPKFKGTHIFSTTAGKVPAYLGSKAKAALDKGMLAALRKDDPKAKLVPFTTHDLRRTARSKFAELGVSDAVAEAMLAHRRPGIVGVYDRHPYAREKREALEKWAAHIRSIVEPPSNNVYPINALNSG